VEAGDVVGVSGRGTNRRHDSPFAATMVGVEEIEEGSEIRLDFGKIQAGARSSRPLLPVVLQHADTAEVLFVGYADEEALNESLATSTAVLWSASRDELWRKGETSGDRLDLVEVRVNCEQNALLYRVRPRTGGVCHTKDTSGTARTSCFYRRIESGALTFLSG
jgi:phosphoribosyl-AMP cyclohydrolase